MKRFSIGFALALTVGVLLFLVATIQTVPTHSVRHPAPIALNVAKAKTFAQRIVENYAVVRRVSAPSYIALKKGNTYHVWVDAIYHGTDQSLDMSFMIKDAQGHVRFLQVEQLP